MKTDTTQIGRFAAAVFAAALAAGAYADGTVSPIQGAEPQKTVTPAPADAQDALGAVQPQAADNSLVTRDEYNGLVADIQTLRDDETRQYQRLTANTLRYVQFDGTLQTRYTYRPDDNPEFPNEFSVPLATLSTTGSLYRDYAGGKNLNFQLQLSYSTSNYAATTSAANTANTETDFTLANAYLSYNVLPTSDPTKPFLAVTLGQQGKPYGLEPQDADNEKPTILPAIWASPAGYNLSGKDIGLTVNGDFFPNEDFGNNYRVAALQYQLGLLNGNGANTSFNAALLPNVGSAATAANTKYSYPTVTTAEPDKTLYGRLAFNAPVDYNSKWRGFTAGLNVVQGHVPGSLTYTGSAITGDLQNVQYGGDLEYVNVPVGFTAEYVQGDSQYLSYNHPSNAVSLADRQSFGATLTVFYEWGQQFIPDYINQDRADDYYPKTYQLFLRSDTWNPDTGLPGNSLTIFTAGFNVFFASTTKLQINYTERKLEGQELYADQLLTQFQYGF
jgi:hypothetical protein